MNTVAHIELPMIILHVFVAATDIPVCAHQNRECKLSACGAAAAWSLPHARLDRPRGAVARRAAESLAPVRGRSLSSFAQTFRDEPSLNGSPLQALPAVVQHTQ